MVSDYFLLSLPDCGLEELVGEVLGGRTGERAAGHGPGDGLSHEGISHDLLQGGPFGGVEDEYLADEVAGVVGEGDVFGEGVGAGLDLLVGGLDLGRLEGRLPHQLRVTA